MNYKLISPITQLLTMRNLPQKGAISDDQLELISEAGILVEDQKIVKIGKYADLKNSINHADTEIVSLEKKYVCVPAFVDCHTHICFAGTRAKDYAMRNSGKTYLDIAKAGGGIWDTVIQTRQASENELVEGIVKRANRHLAHGITTIEVKSGYGLSVEEELKMLRAIQKAHQKIEADLIPTCLAAHILPKDFDGNHAEYLMEISEKLFPILKAEKLTSRMDAFIEKEAFSPQIITSYFDIAKSLNFDITVHSDQFSTGGSEMAVKFGAVSADHLEISGNQEIKLISESNTIAVALPGASLGLGCDFAPARKILDAGGSLVIASDWNPGSAPMGDLLTQASILGTFQKLSNAEVLAGLTFRAANALKCSDRGILDENYLADFILFPTDNYQEILYQQGTLKPEMVYKNGHLVFVK